MSLNDKKQKLMDELEIEKEQIKRSTEEMSAELKRLLESEIKVFHQREKHRSAEMIAIFARHNFYANGLTPQELRTTLEDLGPTYVKMGQIMSSRVDLLPPVYCKELEKLRENVSLWTRPWQKPSSNRRPAKESTRSILSFRTSRWDLRRSLKSIMVSSRMAPVSLPRCSVR